MNNKVRWISFAIVFEIILTIFARWDSTLPIVSENSQVLFFLVPLLIICIIYFIFFILTFIKAKFSTSFLTAVFEEKILPLVVIFVIAFFLLSISLIYFLINDMFLPEISSIYSPFATLGYIIFWEITVLFSFTRKELRTKPKYWIGLPILIAINYFLWHSLVNVGRYLEPYLPQVYGNSYKFVFSTYKWWQLFLPIKEIDGFWVGGYVLTYLIENFIGTAGVWYLFQVLLLLTAFFLSWKVFHSEIFSYFLSICLVFGTHFYHAFQYSCVVSLYLLQTLFILLLYFAYEFIRSEKKYSWHLIALIATLIPTMVMTEGWLDFFASVWAMSVFLFFYFTKIKRPDLRKKVLIVFIIFNIFASIYIYIKFTYLGFTHNSGESKIIFSYGTEYFWRVIEDFISNYFTNLYTTLTNFLPPVFITSNSLYQYSELLEHDNSLMVGHFIYYWRYAAGVLTTLFYVFFFKVLRKVFKENKFSSLLPLFLFMIMIAVNSPTHNIVVHLSFKAMPLIGYYVEQGILGLSLTIAYLFLLLKQKVNNKKLVLLISTFTILVILYSSIRRPNYLGHMIEAVGLAHQGPYPNPLAVLIIKIRTLFPGFLGH